MRSSGNERPPGGAGGGVDARLPEIPEGALLSAAVAISVLTPVIDGIGGVAIKFRAAHPEAFGSPDHSGAAFAGGRGVCDSHKSLSGLEGQCQVPVAGSMTERQILFDPINVGGSEALGLSQRSPAFGTFALKQVASTGPPEQHFTRARDFETLGHRFSGSITFGTSHRLFIWVSAEISRAQDGLQIRKNPSGLELLSCQVAQMIS